MNNSAVRIVYSEVSNYKVFNSTLVNANMQTHMSSAAGTCLHSLYIMSCFLKKRDPVQIRNSKPPVTILKRSHTAGEYLKTSAPVSIHTLIGVSPESVWMWKVTMYLSCFCWL